jgi:multiple sugar transport system ATP-binding protein
VAEVRLVEATRVFRGMWKPAVDHVSLVAADGGLLAVTGPSGSGKSTLLRMVAGLEPVDSGRLLLDGDDTTRTNPDKRGISMLAQGFGLFPQLTVQENIAFPLSMRKTSAKTVAARTAAMAQRCGLAGALGVRPDALNFDQRQRAMMARALIGDPRAVLLDEPLAGSGVPSMMRGRTPIATLQREFGITMVYATCSSVDALAIADQVAVLDRGVLHQIDAPAAIRDRPASVAVAEFVGSPPMNLIPAGVSEGFARVGDLRVKLSAHQAEALTGDGVLIGLHAEDLSVSAPAAALPSGGGEGDASGAGGLRAITVLVRDSGREYLVHARIDTPSDSADLVIRHSRGAPPVRGESLYVTADTTRTHLFDPATGRRLPD